VAVRHADGHVHLVVTLARQDGRRAALHNDFYRVGEAGRAVEERCGVTVTVGRDRTAARLRRDVQDTTPGWPRLR
jgi:hypothetical protein